MIDSCHLLKGTGGQYGSFSKSFGDFILCSTAHSYGSLIDIACKQRREKEMQMVLKAL